MLDWIKKLITGKYLGSIIRHLLTFVAGWLAVIGVSPEIIEQFTSSTQTVLVAVILYLIGQIWSFVEKKNK